MSAKSNPQDSKCAGAAHPRWGRGAEFLLRFRIPVLVAAALFTLFFGRQASRLRSEWNEHEELGSRDPEVHYFKNFIQRFGGQEYLLVVLQTDDVFRPEFLGYLRDLTERLRAVPQATEVVSLATVSLLRGQGDSARVAPFYEEPPATAEAAEGLRREALGQASWVGSLFSADGTTACINVMLPALANDLDERVAPAEAAVDLLRQYPHPGVTADVTGLSPLTRDMRVALRRDLRRFLALTPALILACLYWAFRTRRGVLASAAAIGLSVTWGMGLLVVGGGTLNIGTSLMPTLIAVNCLSYAIHWLNAYHESCARGNDHRAILVRTMVHLAPAMSLAALTTAIGFGSLGLSDLRSIRQLGIVSGLGILLAGLICLVLVPVLLSFLPLPARRAHRHRSFRWLRQGLWRLGGFVARDRWRIPFALASVLVVSALGMRRIQVETQVVRYLPESAPSIRGLEAVNKRLAGFDVLELVLEGAPGTFREPWALREMERLQRQVTGLPGVDLVVSANDLLREAHRARQPEAASADLVALPETAGQIAEYRLLYSVSGHGGLVDSFLARDGSAARLSARIRTLTTADHLRLIGAIERFAAQNLDSRLALRTTGMVKIFAGELHALIRSLILSFGLSFLLIAGLLALQLRSVRAGLCAMIPNVLPIALGLGLMGFLDIPLSASTVMLASVGIGISVDDTIHFLSRYRRERGAERSAASAARRTLLGTGRAMVYSALGLAAGFSVLAFSSFRPNREFGILTAFIMVVALLADLFVTPWLVRAFHLFRRNKT